MNAEDPGGEPLCHVALGGMYLEVESWREADRLDSRWLPGITQRVDFSNGCAGL